MEKKILLGSHGRFAEELIKSAEMIVGELKNVLQFFITAGNVFGRVHERS